MSNYLDCRDPHEAAAICHERVIGLDFARQQNRIQMFSELACVFFGAAVAVPTRADGAIAFGIGFLLQGAFVFFSRRALRQMPEIGACALPTDFSGTDMPCLRLSAHEGPCSSLPPEPVRSDALRDMAEGRWQR